MTLFERIKSDIESGIRKNISSDCSFTVDITSKSGYDFYSNAPKVSGSEVVFRIDSEFVSDYVLDNGFLNFKLKDECFYDFLSEFKLESVESNDEFVKKLNAYIQLAENEKNLAGEEPYVFELQPVVRRLICLLIKYTYVSLHNKTKSDILWTEIVSNVEKLESNSKNLKSFVITYEPLLIAVRGSLAKFGIL